MISKKTKYKKCRYYCLIAVLLGAGCGNKGDSPNAVASVTKPAASPHPTALAQEAERSVTEITRQVPFLEREKIAAVARAWKQTKEIAPAEVLSDDDHLSFEGYVLEKRHRIVREGDTVSRSLRIDVTYAVLKRRDRVLAKFDANVYFGAGNSTRFGLLSILGGRTKQILVSQDRFRGGRQWVVNLSTPPRIVFDGPKWGIRREGDDMRIVDFDGDGVFELAVPMTDFYNLQDKLPIARIPLPGMIFKYDLRAMEYLPAISLLARGTAARSSKLQVERLADETDRRSKTLEQLLQLIYAGKEKQGWVYFDRTYDLGDKEELRRRVRAILVRQPVYKFIYNSGRHQ